MMTDSFTQIMNSSFVTENADMNIDLSCGDDSTGVAAECINCVDGDLSFNMSSKSLMDSTSLGKQSSSASLASQQIANSQAKGGSHGGLAGLIGGDATDTAATSNNKTHQTLTNFISQSQSVKDTCSATLNAATSVTLTGSEYNVATLNACTSMAALCDTTVSVTVDQTNSAQLSAAQTATSKAEGASGFGGLITTLITLLTVLATAGVVLTLLQGTALGQVGLTVVFAVMYSTLLATVETLQSGPPKFLPPAVLPSFMQGDAANSLPDIAKNAKQYDNLPTHWQRMLWVEPNTGENDGTKECRAAYGLQRDFREDSDGGQWDTDIRRMIEEMPTATLEACYQKVVEIIGGDDDTFTNKFSAPTPLFRSLVGIWIPDPSTPYKMEDIVSNLVIYDVLQVYWRGFSYEGDGADQRLVIPDPLTPRSKPVAYYMVHVARKTAWLDVVKNAETGFSAAEAFPQLRLLQDFPQGTGIDHKELFEQTTAADNELTVTVYCMTVTKDTDTTLRQAKAVLTTPYLGAAPGGPLAFPGKPGHPVVANDDKQTTNSTGTGKGTKDNATGFVTAPIPYPQLRTLARTKDLCAAAVAPGKNAELADRKDYDHALWPTDGTVVSSFEFKEQTPQVINAHQHVSLLHDDIDGAPGGGYPPWAYALNGVSDTTLGNIADSVVFCTTLNRTSFPAPQVGPDDVAPKSYTELLKAKEDLVTAKMYVFCGVYCALYTCAIMLFAADITRGSGFDLLGRVIFLIIMYVAPPAVGYGIFESVLSGGD